MNVVEILGCEGAFSDSTTSYLIDEHILVDCSDGTIKSLMKNNRIDNIDTVFITHKHMDHIGGLETLLFYKLAMTGFSEKLDFKVYMPVDCYELYKHMDCYRFNHLVETFAIVENTIINVGDLTFSSESNIHCNGSLTNFSYYINNKINTIIISGDVDKPIVVSPVECKYLFHDVGWTDIPIVDSKVHPTEFEVVKAYNHFGMTTENVIGIHTTKKLDVLKKAEIGDIFKF